MGERFGGRLLAVVGLLGVVAIGPAATPAGAVTCPVVDATTHAVTPAPTDGVDWSGCDLRNADLADAHLAGANLHGAKLAGADARRAAEAHGEQWICVRPAHRAACLPAPDPSGSTAGASSLYPEPRSVERGKAAPSLARSLRTWMSTVRSPPS